MTNNPNHHSSTPDTALSVELRNLYDMNGLRAWRDSEYSEVNRVRAAAGFTPTDQDFRDFANQIETRLDAFLASKGINPADAGYDELRAMYRDAGVDKLTENEWGNSPASRGVDASDHKSASDIFSEKIKAWHETHEVSEPNEDSDDRNHDLTPEEWAAEKDGVNAELDGYLQKYAELVARRSKKMIEGKKTRAEIDAAKGGDVESSDIGVTDLISAVATQMMDELSSAGKSDDEIASAIDVFVKEQADKLMSTMENNRIEEYEKSRGFMKRFYSRWAKWTDQSTDKETGKRKIFSRGSLKKMAALAAPTAGVGAAAGLLLPVAGVGLVAGGAAALTFAGMRSVGRTLVGGYLDRKSMARRLATEQSAEMQQQYEASMAHADAKQRKTIFEVVDERSTIYRKRNLTRAIYGTAIAGTFGVLGGTVAAWASGKIDADRVGDWVSSRWSDFRGDNSAVLVSNGRGADAPKDFWHTDGKNPYAGHAPTIDPDHKPTVSSIDDTDTRGGAGNHPNSPEVPKNDVDTSTLIDKLSKDAQIITKNEGLFQTFAEHDIAKSHWQELLKEVGPKLEAKYPDLVYQDESLGGWGFARTGNLPEGASKIILDSANEHGWLTGDNLQSNLEHPVVDKGEGLNSFVHDNYGHDLTPDQSMQLGAELHEQGAMYQSSALADGAGHGNPYGLNEAGQVNASTDATIRDMVDNGKLDGSYTGNYQVDIVDAAPSVITTDNPATVDSPSTPQDVANTPDWAHDTSLSDNQILDKADLEGLDTYVQEMTGNGLATDWTDLKTDSDTIARLLQSGDIDAINQNNGLQDTLNYMHYDFNGIVYPGTNAEIITRDITGGRWVFNTPPSGAEIPKEVLDIVNNYKQTLYALAA